MVDDAPPPVTGRWIQDLLRDPSLLEPPPVILPRLAWQGRLTMLAAPEKSGKSTLVGQGAAAMVNGQFFLDAVPPAGKVLWLCLDEPEGDLVRRLDSHGVKQGVCIYTERPSSAELTGIIRKDDFRLVVVDTVTEFAAGLVDDANDAGQWQPVLRALRGVFQETGAGGVLLHHTGRSTGTYRGSGQLGAGVDVIIEMGDDEREPTVRKCKFRGRVKGTNFSLRYTEPHYNLESAELPLGMRVLLAVQAKPFSSKNAIRAAVGGNHGAIDLELEGLERRGIIGDQNKELGKKSGSAFYPKNGGAQAGHTWGTVPPSDVSALGPTQAHPGLTSGHTTVPIPLVRGNGAQSEVGDAWEAA